MCRCINCHTQENRALMDKSLKSPGRLGWLPGGWRYLHYFKSTPSPSQGGSKDQMTRPEQRLAARSFLKHEIVSAIGLSIPHWYTCNVYMVINQHKHHKQHNLIVWSSGKQFLYGQKSDIRRYKQYLTRKWLDNECKWVNRFKYKVRCI